MPEKIPIYFVENIMLKSLPSQSQLQSYRQVLEPGVWKRMCWPGKTIWAADFLGHYAHEFARVLLRKFKKDQ